MIMQIGHNNRIQRTARNAAADAGRWALKATELRRAMFIPRMWFDEVERIGKQQCTPAGYALQRIGDLIGFVGLLSVLGVPL